MQITDILAQAGGLEALARDVGVDESQAARGAAALLPAIMGGFSKQAAAQPGGVEGLGGLLGRLGGERLLDDVVSPKPTDVSKGNDVLGQIFGSKDVSRAVAQNASAKSGLDPALLKKMLPIVAMMVAGHMARQRGSGAAQAGGSGGLGGVLGGMLGGKDRGAQPAGGLGGLAAMLDLNKDGNPLDDIMRMMNRK
jgi:hypothetical protein